MTNPSRAFLTVLLLPLMASPAFAATTSSCGTPHIGGHENPSITATTPSSDFIDNNQDGTVIDKTTGLMWKRCIEGGNWTLNTTTNERTCTFGGQPPKFSWQDALAAATSSTFAGHSDWRLPNAKELMSIVERRCYTPALNEQIFQVPAGATEEWTSSPVTGHFSHNAWAVHFDIGNLLSDGQSTANAVRLVRDNK